VLVNKNHLSFTDKLIDFIIYTSMIVVAIVTLYPFINILAISFNDAIDSVRGGIYLWPRRFTLNNYRAVFSYPQILAAFQMSVLRTVVGTGLGVICSSMLAYAISRKDFVARKIITVLFLLTMYFSGGLIPEFFLIRNLGLLNNFWVYILPGLLGAWNIIVIRSFIYGLPESLQESAKLDGANDLTIFFRIIFPLCLPVVATVSLFIAVGQWNSWIDTFLFASANQSLSTLQFELMRILQNTATSMDPQAFRRGDMLQATAVTPEAVRATITIVVTFPILLVYPFLQKYFVHGLTLGSVKS